MVGLANWFDPMAAETYGLFYQNDSPYLFDSSKLAKAFASAGTPTLIEFAPPALSRRLDSAPARRISARTLDFLVAFPTRH
jgi:hypothetical protein